MKDNCMEKENDSIKPEIICDGHGGLRKNEVLENNVESSDGQERRRLHNQMKRSLWEVTSIAVGKRGKVEQNSNRGTDNIKRYDKMELVIKLAIKMLIGTISAIIAAGVYRLF